VRQASGYAAQTLVLDPEAEPPSPLPFSHPGYPTLGALFCTRATLTRDLRSPWPLSHPGEGKRSTSTSHPHPYPSPTRATVFTHPGLSALSVEGRAPLLPLRSPTLGALFCTRATLTRDLRSPWPLSHPGEGKRSIRAGGADGRRLGGEIRHVQVHGILAFPAPDGLGATGRGEAVHLERSAQPLPPPQPVRDLLGP
jgi:hypothetical protein